VLGYALLQSHIAQQGKPSVCVACPSRAEFGGRRILPPSSHRTRVAPQPTNRYDSTTHFRHLLRLVNMQTKREYYLNLVDRIFMRLEPNKMTIFNDGVYRDRLVILAREMVADLERENDPASKVTISELIQFANELEETIEESCRDFVLAPRVFVEAPQSNGTIEWLKNLTDRLDKELVYPEMDLLMDIIEISETSNNNSEEKLEQIDLLLQENPSLLGEIFIEAIEIWTNEKIEESEPDWDQDSVLLIPIYIAEVMTQLSTKYGKDAWKVAIGCYEIVAELESDEEKSAMLDDTLKTFRQALAVSQCDRT
jgi:disulfide oxidoreductase YuzD